MKIHTKNSRSSKKPIVLVLVGIAIVLAILLALYVFGIFPANNSHTVSEQQKQEAKANSSLKDQFLDKNAKDNDDSVENAQPAEVPSSSDTITLDTSQQNESLVVTVKLTSQGYSSGACSLSVTNGAKSVQKTADIIYQPEYSTCSGFSLPVADLGTGNWSMTLSVTPLNGTTLTKTKVVTVQ